MIQLLKDNWYVILAGLSLLVSISRFLLKRRNARREREEQAQRQLKDQALNEALKNSMARRNTFSQSQAAPMGQAGEKRGEKGPVLVRLLVGGTKPESYVLNLENHVYLGRSPSENDIVLNGEYVAPRQCDLFLYQGHAFVRNLEQDNPVVLRRGKKQVRVEGGIVQLMTGDQLIVGYQKIGITLMDYLGKELPG